MFLFFQDTEEDILDRILDSTIRSLDSALQVQPAPGGWFYDDTIMPPTFGEKVIEFFTTPSVLAITVLVTLLIALASFVMHFIMPVKVSVSVTKAGDGGATTTKARTMHASAPVEAAPGVILPVRMDGYSKGGDPCLWGADGRHVATIHFPERHVRRIVDLINGEGNDFFAGAVHANGIISVNDAKLYVLEYMDDDCRNRSAEIEEFLFGRLSGQDAGDAMPPDDPAVEGKWK